MDVELWKCEEAVISEMSKTKLFSWKRIKLAAKLTGICSALNH